MGSTSSGKSLAASNLNQQDIIYQDENLRPSVEPTWKVQNPERDAQLSSTGRRGIYNNRTSDSKDDPDRRQSETSSVIEREVR